MEAYDAAWFRAQLASLGETQASFARALVAMGDNRSIDTIARSVRRMATGEARVAGEMLVILELMRRLKEPTA